MNYDGGNRRDVNGKANAGLTLGIIGTALGAWALFGNRTDALIEKNNTDYFNLYKYTRDADDDIRKELSDLKLNWLLLKLFVLIKINLSNAKWKRCLRLVSTILIERLVMLSMV